MKADPKVVEQLVEIITREVLIAMAEEEARVDTAEGYQCKFDCADQLGVRLCYDRMGNVVNAGAERLTSTLGVIPPEQNLAKMIDHTLLKPDATQQEVAQLCFEAKKHGFASVCVNPTWVSLCAQMNMSVRGQRCSASLLRMRSMAGPAAILQPSCIPQMAG